MTSKETIALINGLPDYLKKSIVHFAQATMMSWEEMDEDDRAEFDNSVECYLGTQILHGALIILESEED